MSSDRDWSDAGGEDIGQATWAENPDSSFDAAFGVDAEDTDAGTGSQSNDEESWDEGADAGWAAQRERGRGFVEGTKIRYQMIVEDAALGSRFYGLIKSTDGGAHWQVVSGDPFGGQMGGGVEFTFLDEMFGFATLSPQRWGCRGVICDGRRRKALRTGRICPQNLYGQHWKYRRAL